METFNNHLCYVILFENHQHGGTHGMTNRLRGYTRQKRLGNTALRNGESDHLKLIHLNPHMGRQNIGHIRLYSRAKKKVKIISFLLS